jgi:hypothetical protein
MTIEAISEFLQALTLSRIAFRFNNGGITPGAEAL